MPKRIYEKWIDCTAEGTALGIARANAIVHAGWQIGPGGYAANGTTTQAAAELPANTLRIFSTSVGVWAIAVSGGTMKLHKSADGIAAYAEKYSTACGRMHVNLPLLVDCGSSRLFVFEYGDDQTPITNNTARVWVSTDAGENWSLLLTTAAGAIRHFHGGLWDAAYSRLYVFTGDGSKQDSILLCSDVDNLIADPATWKTRWGLTDATRSTINSAYYVGYNDYNYRIVNAVINGPHIVYGEDVYWTVDGAELRKWNRSNLIQEKLRIAPHSSMALDGNGVGELWHLGVANNGSILVSTQAWNGVGYGDDFCHVYLVEPNGSTAREILRIPGNGLRVMHYSIHTVGGYTVLSGSGNNSGTCVGKVQMRAPMAMSPISLSPHRLERPGVKNVTRVLLESGDHLLLESGDYMLGES